MRTAYKRTMTARSGGARDGLRRFRAPVAAGLTVGLIAIIALVLSDTFSGSSPGAPSLPGCRPSRAT